jgi:hypothetical protein
MNNIFKFLSMPSRHVPRGVCREDTVLLTLFLHTSFASSILMQALIHIILHFVFLAPSFKMFSIPFIHPIRGLPRLLSPIPSSLYIILVSLSSLILSICPNYLSLFTFILSTILYFAFISLCYNAMSLTGLIECH